MKILQVISYGYLAGGAEKSVLLLKQKLQERGHQVKVIASNHGQDELGQRFSDVEFTEIDRPDTPLAAKAVRHLWHRPAYQAIKTMVTDFEPDVVHFHTMGQLSPSALFAIGSVPGVLTVHGPEEYIKSIIEWGLPKHLFRNNTVSTTNLTALGKAYYLYFGLLQRSLYAYGFRRHLKAMIAPSQYMADVISKEHFDVPVHQIYNGIALPQHGPLPNERQLLYVGRLEYVKGVDVLLRAMLAVAKVLPKVHLHIVGDGAARSELESFVAQEQLRDHVTFCGWLDGHAVNDKYLQTTAVVIPSIWPENLPTVCMEALATGRLVVGSKTGGIPELVQDGITGRIVPPGDVDALAAAIIDLLSRPDLSAASNACASSAQRFAITSFVEKLEDEYRTVMENT
jgi:glycosyltransferase involved in cell wall biosynthesis